MVQRVFMPGDSIDTSLISWLPPGEAYYSRDADHVMWGVCIDGKVIGSGMDKGVAAWFADQLNAARGATERQERYMLSELTKKYGPA